MEENYDKRVVYDPKILRVVEDMRGKRRSLGGKKKFYHMAAFILPSNKYCEKGFFRY